MPRSPEPQLVPRAACVAKEDVPSSESSSEEEAAAPQEEEYTVEEIRASRWDDYVGGWRYLVKWKGYGEDEKTWEPAENLENCRDLVIEFEAQKKAREEKRQALAYGSSSSSKKQKLKKSRASLPSAGESSDDEGVSMKDLDARREKAKKKNRKSGSAGLKSGRVEDAVADKIEKRAVKKAEKKASTSKGNTTFKSPQPKAPAKEDKAKAPAKGDKGKTPTKEEKGKAPAKRPRESIETASSAAKKVKKATPRIAQDSTSDDEPIAAPAPRKPASKSASRPSSSSAAVVPALSESAVDVGGGSSSSSNAQAPPSPPPKPAQPRPPAAAPKPAPTASTSRPPPAPARAPSPAAPAAPQGIPPAVKESLKNLNFKKRAPSPAPVPPPRGVHFDANGSASPAYRQPNGYASPAPGPPTYNGAATAPPHTSAQSQPQPQAHPPVDSQSMVPLAPTAEEQAEKKKRLKDQLIGHEERLRKTAWCNSNPIFDQPGALPLLCAAALHVEPHQIMRMKNRGVAVLFDMSASEQAKGEGHAMGYCLLAVGAETPNVMSKVQAVCLHRTYSFEHIEQLYCELTNLSTHTVEFFQFGGGLPLTPIFTTGYLVVVTRTALQQSAALERFCLNVRNPYGSMVHLTTHPATLAFVRASLPNWNGALGLIHNNEIGVVTKHELKLDSSFIQTDTSLLFSPNQVYPPLPNVTEESELTEVVNYLTWTRASRPEAFRRFIVVSGEAIPEQQARLREKGVELHTWGTLTELIQTNYFG